jgi:hypothetical protein
VSVNRELKDSVFSMLFSDPDTLRELYGALSGAELPKDTPVSINTLSDVVFMEQVNDLSFTVDNRLVVLIEHQSTVNPNVALRMFMYGGRVYEKIIDWRKVYGSKRLVLARPEFIVLYNGPAPYPDQVTLFLSDLFEKAPDFAGGAEAGVTLELAVRVYNINSGHNLAIMRRCRTLEWYSVFIGKAREYKAETGDNERAVRMAVKYCLERGILKEFLETHTSEVRNMLLTEWSTAEYGEVQREEGREEGLEKGREEGQNTVLGLLEQGYTLEEIKAKLRETRTETSGK